MFDLSEFNSVEAAKRLLGCELERQIDDQLMRVRIVETEAYDQMDAASHSFNGKTQRTEVMFGPAEHLYVYFTYGMHYCANIVVGSVGYGAGVLLRAVEPVQGEQFMQTNRGGKTGVVIANGPAKLCQALRIDKRQGGHNLQQEPLRLIKRPAIDSSQIVSAKRVGISREVDKLWRFYIRGNSYVSVLAK